MSDLVETIHAFADLFDRLAIPYAIMGGWAVRLYGRPRPTWRWAGPLGVADKLDEVLATRP